MEYDQMTFKFKFLNDFLEVWIEYFKKFFYKKLELFNFKLIKYEFLKYKK